MVQQYSDFDWAGNKKNRKSTTGFIFILNKGPVSWYSIKQVIVVLSLTEAKYIALTLIAKKVIWLHLLFIKLDFLQSNQEHAFIKVSENNKNDQAIYYNLGINRGGENESKRRNKKVFNGHSFERQ